MPVSPLLPDDPPRIGPYELTGRLGQGGQGIVYLATSAEYGQVAVKTLIADTAADPMVLARFAREVQAAGRVPSHCTARVLDSDLSGTPRYIVSEYVEGLTLQQTVTERGPLAGDDLMRLAIATATALTAIHGAGVVHRDFKPGNVILGGSGIRVVDFGIARELSAESSLTGAAMVGTPLYMTPEQVEGLPATAAVDIFAWAGVVVFAATGSSPFAAPTVTSLFKRILQDEPDLGGLAEPLRGVVAACLAKDPAARPSADALLIRLLGGPSAGQETINVTRVMAEGTRIAEGATLPPTNWQYGNTTAPPRPFVYYQPSVFPAPVRQRRSKLPWLLGCGIPLAIVGLIVAGVAFIGQQVENKRREALKPLVAVPAELAGSWMGTLNPQDGTSHDVFRMTLTAGRQDGHESYLLNGCTGTLVPQRISGGELTLNESVSSPCTSSQLRVRKRSDGRLNLVMFTDTSASKVSQTAQLTRLPKSGPPRLPDSMTGTWVAKDSDGYDLNLVLASTGAASAGNANYNGEGACPVVATSASAKHAVLQAGGHTCRSYRLDLTLAANHGMSVHLKTDDGYTDHTFTAHRVD